MTIKLHGKRPVCLPGLIVAYGFILALLTVLNWFGADRWWLGAFNLYLPQAVWLAPVVLLTIPSLVFARRWVWVLGIYCIWVCGPIMGFCWILHAHPESAVSLPVVRVMTCNIKYGQRDITALISDIVLYKPDVVFLQDVEKVMNGPLGTYFQDWNVRSSDQYVIASRLPLAKADVRWISFPGDQESCLRTDILLGNTPITLYNVHFLTPRNGLNAFKAARNRPSRFVEAVQELQDNVEHRLIQARALSELARQEQGAVIVAGDLNSPDESLVCRTLRDAHLHDAFAEGGTGYGYTYGHFLLRRRIPWLSGISWMRIDHIMLSSRLRSQHCWTGTGEASDHRPVFADLSVATP